MGRFAELFPDERDRLLRESYRLWGGLPQAMRLLKVDTAQYRATQALAFQLVAFAKEISAGETNFGNMQASSGTGYAKTWTGADPIEADVDEAIALSGGDPRAAVRSLIVLTRALDEGVADELLSDRDRTSIP